MFQEYLSRNQRNQEKICKEIEKLSQNLEKSV